MQKLNLVLVISAIFSISLLLGQINTNIALAQSFSVLDGFAHPIIALHYQSDNDLIWILTGEQTTGKTVLYWVDRATLSVVGSFNHTISVQGGVGNAAFDIWCGKTDCYITTAHVNSGVNGQILRISTEDIAPDIFRGQNVTGTFTHTDQIYHITGRDAVSGGFGSVTLWVDVCSVTIAIGCADDLWIIDGISMLFVGELQNYGITNHDWKVKDMVWSGIAGITDNHLLSTHSPHVTGQISSRFYITDLATISTHCFEETPTISGTLSIPISIAGNYFSAGDANNKVYVGTNGGHIFVYDTDCNLLQTIDSSETGITNNIRYLEYSAGRVFFQGDGASAPIIQMLTNATGHIIETDKTTYLPLPSSSQQLFDDISDRSTIGDMILFSGFGKVWFPYTGTDKKVGILAYDASGGGGGSGVEECFDINPSTLVVQLLCLQDTDGDGIPDAPNSGFVFRAGKNVTAVSNDFFCSLGILADSDSDGTCDNYDVKTNGVGYIITIILFAFMITMFAVAKLKTSLHIPEWLWIIGTFAVLGAGIGFKWLDQTLLIIGIIIMCAMASFRVYSALQSRFGGGDD